jgi:hypothetical protein
MKKISLLIASLLVFTTSVFSVTAVGWISFYGNDMRMHWLHIGPTKVVFELFGPQECKYLMEQNGCQYASYNFYTHECRIFTSVTGY